MPRYWPGLGHSGVDPHASLEIVDEFQHFVRPVINPPLTEFCKKLTSIHQADVDSAETYAEVGHELGVLMHNIPTRLGRRGATTMQGS